MRHSDKQTHTFSRCERRRTWTRMRTGHDIVSQPCRNKEDVNKSVIMIARRDDIQRQWNDQLTRIGPWIGFLRQPSTRLRLALLVHRRRAVMLRRRSRRMEQQVMVGWTCHRIHYSTHRGWNECGQRRGHSMMLVLKRVHWITRRVDWKLRAAHCGTVALYGWLLGWKGWLLLLLLSGSVKVIHHGLKSITFFL
jgi:hypothetical protein